MIVSCPKCGQQLRGDPGSIGTCPKCQTRLQFPEGDSNQGEPITCPHCGQSQRYKDGICISCGKSLSEKESVEDKPESNKKRIIIAVASLIIAFAVLGVALLPKTGLKWFLTDEQKASNIMKAYRSEGYSEALSLVVEYYGTESEDALAWASILLDTEEEKIIEDMEVVDQSLVLDGNYYDYEAHIKNNSSKTLTYIEVNIYLYDENGEIINTEWTNWSGTLPPGASTYLDTMIKDTGNAERFKTEISDVSTT